MAELGVGSGALAQRHGRHGGGGCLGDPGLHGEAYADVAGHGDGGLRDQRRDGTATAGSGSDYTAASGTLTFTAGQTSKTVAVKVLDDLHDEGSETLTHTLSNASGAPVSDATATRHDHQPRPAPAAMAVVVPSDGGGSDDRGA